MDKVAVDTTCTSPTLDGDAQALRSRIGAGDGQLMQFGQQDARITTHQP